MTWTPKTLGERLAEEQEFERARYMSIDNWIDGGIGGEARQQHDEGVSDGRRTHTQSLAPLTDTQEAELATVEREKAELRRRLGLMPEQRFDELVSWLLGPRPEGD